MKLWGYLALCRSEKLYVHICVDVYILSIAYAPECLPVIKQQRCCVVYSVSSCELRTIFGWDTSFVKSLWRLYQVSLNWWIIYDKYVSMLYLAFYAQLVVKHIQNAILYCHFNIVHKHFLWWSHMKLNRNLSTSHRVSALRHQCDTSVKNIKQ